MAIFFPAALRDAIILDLSSGKREANTFSIPTWLAIF
jgi:hypothetical protein